MSWLVISFFRDYEGYQNFSPQRIQFPLKHSSMMRLEVFQLTKVNPWQALFFPILSMCWLLSR